MNIERLKLNNYRNYLSLDIRPEKGVNVITGENAQGKTNAVEAIFLCALGRSHRTPRDGELIKSGTAGGYVGVELSGAGGDHLIEWKLRDGERKKLFIDRNQAQRSGELMGILNVVMFSPEDLSLVKQGPAERRRFMDMELSQLSPAYYFRLQQYNLALRQRNALLKGEGEPGLLTVFDEQLAKLGGAIMTARQAFIDRISTIAFDLHRTITGGREVLGMEYRPNVRGEVYGSMDSAIFDLLQRSASEDQKRGFTTVGPHRDDVYLGLDGGDVRVYGSQGQQRTAALSMKLSEIALLREEKGEAPVVLLDDVLSELDDGRARQLLLAVGDCQTFLTCTGVSALDRANVRFDAAYVCKEGTLERQ